MPNEQLTQAILKELFAGPDASIYAVLDGASVPNLLERLAQDSPEHCCLYRGELAPDLAEAAPYLVRLERDSPFTSWVIEKGWGNHWGIFAAAKADLRTMRKHFRTFLMVYDPEGKPLYFRYYDPRVLRVYLPTTNGVERGIVFGPVVQYVSEAESGTDLLRFVPDKAEALCKTLVESTARA